MEERRIRKRRGIIVRATRHTARLNALQLDAFANDIKRWGRELGFQQIAVTDAIHRTTHATLPADTGA